MEVTSKNSNYNLPLSDVTIVQFMWPTNFGDGPAFGDLGNPTTQIPGNCTTYCPFRGDVYFDFGGQTGSIASITRRRLHFCSTGM